LRWRAGRLLLEMLIMRRCQREACRRAQSRFLRRGEGVTVDGLWFCSEACVEELALERLQHPRTAGDQPITEPLRMRLGAWLRHDAAITSDQLATALETQRRTGLKLGEQIVQLGFATSDVVVRALARQAGVRHLTRVDPASVRRAPGDLSRHVVRALSVVPFCEPMQGTIKVACTAPVPRIALSALHRITGLMPEPYMISDRLWRELLESYGADTFSHAAGTTDIAEAAALIARAAAESRGARLAEIHWDPYTWVRVLADTGTHDVVLEASRGR